KIKVGNPSEADVIVGPIIDDVHVKRISDWVNEAIEAGAVCEIGGRIIDEKKSLYAPTLLSNVDKKMKVYSEEVFGPVATLSSFENFELAIGLVEDSNVGLQCGVFTNDFSHVKYSQQHPDVGGIIINSVPGFRIDLMPFG